MILIVTPKRWIYKSLIRKLELSTRQVHWFEYNHPPKISPRRIILTCGYKELPEHVMKLINYIAKVNTIDLEYLSCCHAKEPDKGVE